ncbi:MAG TPA: HAMP domain-containing histidine kinase [Crocinitomix sp.]|nr:HAMP domain-containing histidine kinase [Crocinitomix sp.]
MSVALFGLLLLQFYWIRNVHQLHLERFTKEATNAIKSAVYDLENIEQNAVYSTIRNQKLSQNLKNRFGFNSVLKNEQIITIKDTSLSCNPDYSTNCNTDYLVVSGISFDSLTGVTAEHRVITQNYSKLFKQNIEHNNIITGLDSTVTFNDKIGKVFEEGLLKKSKFLNEMLLKMFTSNLFDDIKLRLNPMVLDSILYIKLKNFSIDTTYLFRVVNEKNNVVDFNNTPKRYSSNINNADFRFKLYPSDFSSSNFYLEIDFPNKKVYLFKQMLGTLIAAILLVCMVVFAFYFAVSTIFKQKRLSEIKNDFISNMTHELKTPISTISLACEAITDPDVKTNPSTLTTFIDMISSENKRLGLLVEKVLQTSLLEKGKLSLNKSTYQIDELVRDAVNSFRIQFQQKGGDLRIIQLDKIEWSVDKIHFSNVLYNLMDNALKYSKEKPVCTVELIKEKDGFSFLISDNGIGIKKEEQKLIFEKLYRVSTGDVHNVKGFGLGLDYVKRIVEMHGGEITLKSEYKVGTTFKIRFKNEQ